MEKEAGPRNWGREGGIQALVKGWVEEEENQTTSGEDGEGFRSWSMPGGSGRRTKDKARLGKVKSSTGWKMEEGEEGRKIRGWGEEFILVSGREEAGINTREVRTLGWEKETIRASPSFVLSRKSDA